jgi:glucose/arabinose dehydrogenase
MVSTMRRAAAVGVSPNRITLLRDANGDGVAETGETFLDGLSQPFGMALLGDTFYVGNTDGVVAFPYERESYGRPVGVAIGPGGCLLVADDVGNVIWRVTAARPE